MQFRVVSVDRCVFAQPPTAIFPPPSSTRTRARAPSTSDPRKGRPGQSEAPLPEPPTKEGELFCENATENNYVHFNRRPLTVVSANYDGTSSEYYRRRVHAQGK